MKRLSNLALEWCIPLLVASSILLQQQDGGFGILWWAGQALSIAGTIAAIIIVYCWPRHRAFTSSLIIGVIALRFSRMILPEDSLLFSVYEPALLVLMVVVGYMMTRRDPGLIERQLVFICLLGLPVMLLQMLGVAEWSQWLRTDFHDGGLFDLTQYPTFLVSYDELATISTLQLRPSGLFASNNAFSLVLVLAVGLRMSRFSSGLQKRDIWLALACVLAMAKTVFGVVGGVSLWILFLGNKASRIALMYFILAFAAYLLGYFIFFPGLWANNVDPESWMLNFSLRAIGVEQGLNVDLIGDELRNLARTQRAHLFDGSGNLIKPEGSLALMVTAWQWYLPGILLAFASSLIYFLRKVSFYELSRALGPHAIVIAVCLAGLGLAASALFAIYLGIVGANIMKLNSRVVQ